MSSTIKTEGDIDFEIRDQLLAKGWNADQLRYQHQIAPGRIYKSGDSYITGEPVKPDFILDYKPQIDQAEARPLAVVEDKNVPDVEVAAGIQQAKHYAEIMNLKFAYSTNGTRIVEYDFFTGQQSEISEFPTPEELWTRSQGSKPFKDEYLAMIFQPYNREVRNSDLTIRRPRYYQVAAIEAAIDAIAKGQKRILDWGINWEINVHSHGLWSCKCKSACLYNKNRWFNKSRISQLVAKFFLYTRLDNGFTEGRDKRGS